MTKKSNNSRTFSKKYYEVLLCFFLVIATLSVYSQVHKYDFINFDDPMYVTENRHVQEGLTSKSIIWAFTTFHMGNWHPLTWLSHMLDCEFYGIRPGCHHLTNLIFHILSTILLFFVFKKMTGSLWQSALVAALFTLHPLHVESVAWISERKDVLSTFFWMLTMWGYILYVEHPAVKRYLLVIVFFALGLISKPMLVTLPFVLLLLDFWPLYRFRFQQPDSYDKSKQRSIAIRLLWEKVPLFILVAIISTVTFYAQKQVGAVASFDITPLKARIANALVSYIKYIGKMIYPSKLAVFYPHPGILPGWKITGACLVLVFITFLAIRVVKQRPYFTVGWLWYIGTLVPVIGLVQVGAQSIADRYTYIPLIGLFLIIAWGISDFVVQQRYIKIAAAILVTVLLPILMTVTWKQVGYWKNSITLFEHALEVTSKNWLLHNNLGDALNKQGRMEEAINHFLEALRINPNYAKAHNNLGNALNKQGRMEEAINHYLEALGINPDYADAHYNLGVTLNKKGRTDEAIDHYLEALRIKPDYVDAHYNLGAALYKQGRIEEAVEHYLEALRIKPDYVETYNRLGVAFFHKGNIERAIACFRDALRLKPDYADAHYNLGNALNKQGRIEEAVEHYLEALRIKPDYVDAHYNLGNALNKQGRIEEAVEHYLEALRIKPDYVDAHYNLGNALKMVGRTEEAIDHYLEALRIKPDHVDAHNNLGIALKMVGRTEEAIDHYLEALRIKPDFVNAHNNLGVALFSKGDIEGAIACFQDALRIKPDNINAKNNLKKVLMIQQNK